MTSTNRNRKSFGIALVLALVATSATLAGGIGAVEKYRAPQIDGDDVILAESASRSLSVTFRRTGLEETLETGLAVRGGDIQDGTTSQIMQDYSPDGMWRQVYVEDPSGSPTVTSSSGADLEADLEAQLAN